MIRKIAHYRNERIDFTMRTHALTEMVYHCTIRDVGVITVQECPLVPINTDCIKNIKRRKNSIAFNDGLNEYSFSVSKSTLYKKFTDLKELQRIPVEIIEDPYAFLAEKMGYLREIQRPVTTSPSEKLIDSAILPLYSENKTASAQTPGAAFPLIESMSARSVLPPFLKTAQPLLRLPSFSLAKVKNHPKSFNILEFK